MRRELARRIGEQLEKNLRQRAVGQNARPVRREPEESLGLATIDRRERLVHGEHQHFAAHVRLRRVAMSPLVGRDRGSERAVGAGRVAELLPELIEQAGLPNVAACRGQPGAHDIPIGESLKQRDEIRKRFVEGEHIRVRRKHEARAKSVEQGVRYFMRHDVMRQRGAHHALWRFPPRHALVGPERAQAQLAALRIVVRVARGRDARSNAKSRWRLGTRTREAPRDLTSKGMTKSRVRRAAHRVRHLSPKQRIGWRRSASLRDQNVRIVEIERLGWRFTVQPLVDHLEQRADRAGLERLIRHVDHRDRAVAPRRARVEREYTKRAIERIARIALVRLDLTRANDARRNIEVLTATARARARAVAGHGRVWRIRRALRNRSIRLRCGRDRSNHRRHGSIPRLRLISLEHLRVLP